MYIVRIHVHACTMSYKGQSIGEFTMWYMTYVSNLLMETTCIYMSIGHVHVHVHVNFSKPLYLLKFSKPLRLLVNIIFKLLCVGGMVLWCVCVHVCLSLFLFLFFLMCTVVLYITCTCMYMYIPSV